MQSISDTYSPVEKVENLLDEVFEDLSVLTEENFDEKFPSAHKKMQLIREIKSKNRSKLNLFRSSKKVIQLAKLISERYDNITKDWANKLKLVQKEIELSQNQKKITIYNR
jgi:hypothetical protein